MAHFLDTRPQAVNLIRVGAPTGVNPQEDLPLLMATGWRGDPAAATTLR